VAHAARCVIAPLDVNNVHLLQRQAHEYSCLWAGAAAAAHCRRPLGIGLLLLLAYCCWRQININITLFSRVTLISKVQSTSDLDYLVKVVTYPVRM